MTRLIDANEIEKVLEEKHFNRVLDSDRWIIADIKKSIMDLPTIDAVPQWIPCSERLPEIKGHYVSETCLVCLDNGAIGFSELQENIFGQVGWSCEREDDYHEPLGDVIAWMPLPKPYEVENG